MRPTSLFGCGCGLLHLHVVTGVLILSWLSVPSRGAPLGLPPPGPPSVVRLEETDARTLVESLFGCEVLSIEDSDHRWYRIGVGRCALPCPLERVRDTRCGKFRWEPEEVVVFQTSFTAPMSGHLARNRVVAVDLRSSKTGLVRGSLHGILVFPAAEVSPSARPAFAWYLSRLGRTLGLDLRDINADGSLDLLYTYESFHVGGIRLVSRDVWTFEDLRADRLISSGDALTGMAVGAYDGVPLHRDHDDGFERGGWRIEVAEVGRSPLIVVERAGFPGWRGPDWEMQVVADLGEGWMEVLSGVPVTDGEPRLDISGLPTGTCSPSDVPAGLSLRVRERLLELERACRLVRVASLPSGKSVWFDSLRWLWAAASAASVGLRMVALSLESSAATAWLQGNAVAVSARRPDLWSTVSFLVASGMSFHVAWSAYRKRVLAYDPRFSEPPEWSELEALPALRPWVVLGSRLHRAVRGWFGPMRAPRSPPTDTSG